MQESEFQSLGQEDSPEEGMATHSSILAWEIPWTEEPGGLQFMGLQRHNLVTIHIQQPCGYHIPSICFSSLFILLGLGQKSQKW